MSRANQSAFPIHVPASSGVHMGGTSGWTQNGYSMPGLTIREYFAAMAMQGILTRSHLETNSQSALAVLAVSHADALLAELAK